MSSFHNYIPAAYLPENYGGELPKINYTSADWYPVLLKHEDKIQREVFVNRFDKRGIKFYKFYESMIESNDELTLQFYFQSGTRTVFDNNEEHAKYEGIKQGRLMIFREKIFQKFIH